jgi:CRP/FNR family transcriptional regulator
MNWLPTVAVKENRGTLPRVEPSFSPPSVVPAPPAATTSTTVTVAANAFLHKAGDPRTHFYRVETGSLWVYETRRESDSSLIEFVFPGDYVGLGCLERHALNARALLNTTLTCIPVSEMERTVGNDPRARAKLSVAMDRELEARRNELHHAGQRRPIERVAALLVTSARTNVQQGRPAELIKDSWRCGFVADLLQMTLDDLSAMLLDLERRGLIAAAGQDLLLTNIPGLEQLADGILPDGGRPAVRIDVPQGAYKAA